MHLGHEGLVLREHLFGRLARVNIVAAGAQDNHPWLVREDKPLGEVG